MRTGRPKIKLTLSKAERAELQKIAARRVHPSAALHAGLILDCARGLDNQTVALLHNVTPLTVGKWRQRFLVHRLNGMQKTATFSATGPILGDGVLQIVGPPEPAKFRPVQTEAGVGLQKRVTLRDIANHLNLHLSTVSLGLKNDPRLIPATRQRIQEAAQVMQYRPDPMAKALSVYRQAIRPTSQHGSLAFLAHPSDQVIDMLEVVRERAARFGYKIELVDCYSTRRTKEQLTRLLRLRGIQGLIVLPPSFGRNTPRRLQVDWKFFSAVVLGHALYHPLLHQVSNDHLGNAQMLTRNLLSLGYRRIGLCIGEQFAFLHAGGGWEGGYWVEMRRQENIPKPFYRRTFEPDEESIPEIQKWIEREHLDAVILDNDAIAMLLSSHLRECNPSIGIACLVCYQRDYYSGVAPNYDHVWSAAVDFLVHLINTHQRGIPEIPQRVLLRGNWVAGKTLHRQTDAK